MPEQVAVVLLGLAISLLLVLVVLGLYRRRMAAARGRAGGAAWTGPCVDPLSTRSWSALVIDDGGVSLRSLWSGATRTAWSWHEIDVDATGTASVRIGLRRVEGLHLALKGGGSAEYLLPSRSLFRYPPSQVRSALDAIRRHRV